MSAKFKLGLSLFLLGFLGVLTMLTVDIPLNNIPKEALKAISPEVFKYFSLINPTFFLIIAVVIGTLLYDKAGLTVPFLSSILKIKESEIKPIIQVKFGIILGLTAGFSSVVVSLIYGLLVPNELQLLDGNITVTPIARFGYGGITEEVLMRFGFMTFVTWVIQKISKTQSNITYWFGILLSSLLFAIGHFPIVYSAIQNPTTTLLSYILIGNTLGGFCFGWLYWKKGLEAAFVGHIFSHVTMLLAELIIELI